MNRRQFALALAASATLPAAALADAIDYTPGLVADRLAAGETVFLDFTADWCSTCAAQARVLERLKAENPAYEAAITFVDVDWDDFRRAAITRNLNIPRRSTLVVLRGQQELGRLIAGTRYDQIKELMDTALAASS